jgi:low temperature requirement protein LtrA
MTQQPSRFQLRTRMTARDTEETHRVSSPLELLFDLTFVVAVAQLALAFAERIEAGHGADEIPPFLMVFFAIWWAWVNFSWFASAYDTDDVPYRLMTLLQMGGVLVLAVGVPAAFEHANFFGIILGYFIMRVGLVGQWIRAAIENPEGRTTAIRYAVGITVVQLGWISWPLLLVNGSNQLWTVYLPFLILATADVSVPGWAERTGKTNWHPHHIAERYGLFTIILLGETIAALAAGSSLIAQEGVDVGALVLVGISCLVLIFALWWLYFMEPAGDGLQRHRGWSYVWGYGHCIVFAALGALGGGVDVLLKMTAGSEVSPLTAAYVLAIPIAVYLLSLWAVHAPIVPRSIVPWFVVIPGAVLVLLVPLLTSTTGLPIEVALDVAVVVLIVVLSVVVKHRQFHREHPSTIPG